ncbi:hypothetical protein FHS23_000260 [Prauserella isguenensis]|uniref:PE domain-containing protein n=1 Tax=Prauserella isguenensis TaxID=1470180 RepID=A0A839RVS7_9PSEU|nr:hypothetical protein [Prauserella isguenensis]MBB3049265.1 hypothetical protein [Prauserella isguenensis]
MADEGSAGGVGAEAFAGVEASGQAKASGGFWDQAVFAVQGAKGTATADGWAKGAVTSGPIAGGFMMDPETAEGMVRKAKWIADQMQQQRIKAERLLQSGPPAHDPGSDAFQKVAHAMFGLGAESVAAQWRRYRDIAEKLQKALDVYNETDEQAGKDAKKSGGGLID